MCDSHVCIGNYQHAVPHPLATEALRLKDLYRMCTGIVPTTVFMSQQDRDSLTSEATIATELQGMQIVVTQVLATGQMLVSH